MRAKMTSTMNFIFIYLFSFSLLSLRTIDDVVTWNQKTMNRSKRCLLFYTFSEQKRIEPWSDIDPEIMWTKYWSEICIDIVQYSHLYSTEKQQHIYAACLTNCFTTTYLRGMPDQLSTSWWWWWKISMNLLIFYRKIRTTGWSSRWTWFGSIYRQCWNCHRYSEH